MYLDRVADFLKNFSIFDIMKFASLSKNGISIDVIHDEDESLDWFIDNSVKITFNKLPFICCDLEAAKEFIIASKDEQFAYDFNEAHKDNVRWSMIKQGRQFMLMVFIYPEDLSEEEIREDYKAPDHFFLFPQVKNAEEAMDHIFEVANSIDTFDQYEYSPAWDGTFKYHLN